MTNNFRLDKTSKQFQLARSSQVFLELTTISCFSREISKEYCKRTREVARELLKGISESLGLEASYIDNTLNLNSGFQLLIANLYPPCPQPDLAMGLPPHSDHGLLTLLTQNGIGGLQLQHNGKWVNVDAPPNSFLVNTGDHIEVRISYLLILFCPCTFFFIHNSQLWLVKLTRDHCFGGRF